MSVKRNIGLTPEEAERLLGHLTGVVDTLPVDDLLIDVFVKVRGTVERATAREAPQAP